MTFKTRFLSVSMIALLAIGISACSKEKQDESEKISAIMFKNPGCQCCDKWAAYMEQNGFSVSIEEAPNMPAVKRQNGVPYPLQSCHTVLISNYVVEGHVSQEDIRKLLEEQPEARGIAVPGMPIGSPGMEGTPEESYNVYLFGGQGNPTVYARH